MSSCVADESSSYTLLRPPAPRPSMLHAAPVVRKIPPARSPVHATLLQDVLFAAAPQLLACHWLRFT
jgi:hypothetical protein